MSSREPTKSGTLVYYIPFHEYTKIEIEPLVTLSASMTW